MACETSVTYPETEPAPPVLEAQNETGERKQVKDENKFWSIIQIAFNILRGETIKATAHLI